MIGAVQGHHFPSSRRAAVSQSTRRLAAAMGIELHDRRPPGLVASLVILGVIALFTLGLFWGPLDHLVGWMIGFALR
jgi:hypothetical protein